MNMFDDEAPGWTQVAPKISRDNAYIAQDGIFNVQEGLSTHAMACNAQPTAHDTGPAECAVAIK